MSRLPSGAPQPLLSVDCLLSVMDYTATPGPTISGGMTPDRTDEFRRAADGHLPVDFFTSEPHPMLPDLFGDVMIAELDTDRIGLNRYLSFVREYARLSETDDLRVVNTGIDARTTTKSCAPRLFADAEVLVAVLVEIRFRERFTSSEIRSILNELEAKFSWVADTVVRESDIGLLRHHGGPNDLVVTQTLNLIEELERHNIELDQATISCSPVEKPSTSGSGNEIRR